ncbi:hypothetical protein [Streptomyces sp. NPDC127072]|uniref:hypothetical protein n=1 Tax=Streptomyces sp. NPDC127072 TaxID=3347129 RepID=UPI00365BCAF1
MKRLFIGVALASISVLTATGCSASREETYWDAFDAGAQVAQGYQPPPKGPECTDGSITDTAEYLMSCSGWDSPSEASIREQCGQQLPDDVSDRAVWMEGCADGANDSPNYESFGKHP